jgi:hypothetical protein
MVMNSIAKPKAFSPIHKFIPRKQENKYGDKGQVTEWGKEHFIAFN